MLTLAPSILSADFSKLGVQIERMYNSGVRYIHIDVMDGHFVPNISFGAPVISSICKYPDLVFDVHLMVDQPEKFIPQMSDVGADIINFHLEATEDPLALIKTIKELGKKPAVTLKMETPIESVYGIAEELYMILLMSIDQPGFGGQVFNPEVLKKASDLRGFLTKNNLGTHIQMDGGISTKNAKDIIDSGVNILVAGSSVLGNDEIESNIKKFLDIFDIVN